MSIALHAKQLLIRAVECDQNGRVLEAQTLYERGIDNLMQFVSEEADDKVRQSYTRRIREYVDRAESIKSRVNGTLMLGEVITHISINENDTGNDYDQLFGKYINESTIEILLEEPYMAQNYQFYNLVRFLELAVTNAKNLKYVRLVTKKDSKNREQQKFSLEQINSDLEARQIHFWVSYDDALHDRRIFLSNGYIIKIGRGLHFYKPTNPLFSIGLVNYKYRKCLQTDVDICRNKHSTN